MQPERRSSCPSGLRQPSAGELYRPRHREFHQVYQKIPSNYYHDKEFRAVYEKDGIRAVAELTKGRTIQRTSDKSWNSHNSPLHAFFLWCAGKGCALPKETESICKDEFVKIKKPKKHRSIDDDGHEIHQPAKITTVFSALKFMGCRSRWGWRYQGGLVVRGHRYWMPLIAASHGNRREVAALLKVKHVKKTAAGIWYFNWAATELSALLKDIGSPRDVPLHSTLLELGFLEARVLGRDPEARVFPEAVSYGVMHRDAEPFGKWYGQFRRACNITELDFHSWRHTVITMLARAGVPDSQIEEIVGHESEQRRSELRTYNHGSTIEMLKMSIDKLVLPIDIAAMKAAVARSDAIDRSAAWPDLADPRTIPKPKRKEISKQI